MPPVVMGRRGVRTDRCAVKDRALEPTEYALVRRLFPSAGDDVLTPRNLSDLLGPRSGDLVAALQGVPVIHVIRGAA